MGRCRSAVEAGSWAEEGAAGEGWQGGCRTWSSAETQSEQKCVNKRC